MELENLQSIGANIGLLLVAATFVAIFNPRREAIGPYSFGLGAMFGLLIVGSLLLSFEFTPGVITDLRFVPAILAGLMGGPVAAVTAGAIGTLARWYMGGAGWISGSVNLLIPAALGALFWLRNRKLGVDPSLWQFLALGALSGILSSIPVLLFIPGARDWPIQQVIAMISPPTLASLLALLLIGLIWHRIELLANRAAALVEKTEVLGSELIKSEYSLAQANKELRLANEKLELAQEVTIRALARLAEARDQDTGNHILRTQRYVNLLAKDLQKHSRYHQDLSDDLVELITKSAPLHDIGKVGIPDGILQKPGKLTAAEWEIMKTHSALGAEALEAAEKDVERPIEFLHIAKQIARHHHERWDGSGYPDGLAGEDIPLSARLMAVADVFDALVCARVYKDEYDFEESYRLIIESSGSHFDPAIVDAFTRCYRDFKKIAVRFKG